jgi:hypothetical protein
MVSVAQKLSTIEWHQGKTCFGEEITGTKVTNPKTVLGSSPSEDIGFGDNFFLCYSTICIEWSGPWKALIFGFRGRCTSTRWERRQLKDWVCLAPSLTGQAVCPSETVCCSTSSSSVLWWITHVWSGGPLPAATSGSCKFYNPSVSHCD